MKELNFDKYGNIFALTDDEIAVIHALAVFVAPETDMTPAAKNIVRHIRERFDTDRRIGCIKVWK